MKKIIRIYLAVLCMAAGLAVGMISTDTVYADGSGDFEYGTFPDTGLLCVDRYTGSDKDVVIPGMIDGKPVGGIGDGMFEDSDITSVTIPSGVYKIEEKAFLRCRNLVSVSIPDTVTIIEEEAFLGCESLKNIDLPPSLRKIEDMVFYDCSNLAEIHIPDSATEIGEAAFKFCSSLTKVRIPEGVTEIGEQAFSSCHSLEEVIIPESVTKIEGGAFSSCSSLAKVRIPEGVTEIEDEIFRGCLHLKEVQLASRIKSIGKEAFMRCEQLERINGSGSDIEIGEAAFESCGRLESISISGVTKIGERAFYDSGLKEINLDGVISIGKQVFWGSSLTVVNIPNVKTIGNAAFNSCELLREANFLGEEPVIEGSIFRGCKKLESIRFPHGVTAVGQYDVENCDSLVKVSLSDTVTNIGIDAFYEIPLQMIEVDEENPVFCSIDGVLYHKKREILVMFPRKWKGDSYHVPDGTTEIHDRAFYDCRIENLYLPAGVTKIGRETFKGGNYYDGICYLKNIYYAGTKEQWNKIQNNSIEDLEKAKVTVHFQDGSTLKLGSNTSQGSVVSSERFEYRVTSAGENAEVMVIRMIGAQTESVIPDWMTIDEQPYKVTAIADGALAGSKTLKKLVIGKYIKSIGKNAFKGCSNLKYIKVKSTRLQSVGKNAFKGIYAGAKIKVPSNKLAAYKKVLKGKGQGSMVKITN